MIFNYPTNILMKISKKKITSQFIYDKNFFFLESQLNLTLNFLKGYILKIHGKTLIYNNIQ